MDNVFSMKNPLQNRDKNWWFKHLNPREKTKTGNLKPDKFPAYPRADRLPASSASAGLAGRIEWASDSQKKHLH